MQLDAAQIAQYESDGFIDVPDLFTAADTSELRDRTRDIAEGRVVTFPTENIEFEPGQEGVRQLAAVRKLNHCATSDEVFARHARHAPVLDIVESLLGPDIKLYGSQAFMKPPGGIEKTYHQDSPYFSIEPMALVTCWIALDDTTIENGCLWVIPGSHQAGALPHSERWLVGGREDMRIPDSMIDRAREVPITMSASSCSFHHSLLLHSSRPNTTSHSRRGLAYHYMTAESRWTDPDREQPEYPLLRGRSYPGCV